MRTILSAITILSGFGIALAVAFAGSACAGVMIAFFALLIGGLIAPPEKCEMCGESSDRIHKRTVGGHRMRICATCVMKLVMQEMHQHRQPEMQPPQQPPIIPPATSFDIGPHPDGMPGGRITINRDRSFHHQHRDYV